VPRYVDVQPVKDLCYFNMVCKIFEMQTGYWLSDPTERNFVNSYISARIRQDLGREHDFVFVEGTVPTAPDSGPSPPD
jgi:hypothetical protein